MHRIFTLFTLIMLLSVNVFSNKAPAKFGKVPMEDIRMTVYEHDTSAIAVVLCDYGVFDSRTFQFFRLLRIKILKKEGLDWANKVFPGSEKTSIRGKTMNLVDGKTEVTKLNGKSIFKERVFDDNFNIRVAMPNVKVGSVIDIEFSFPGIPTIWYFQQTIPVRWSELIIESSPYIDFRKNMFGYEPLHVSTDSRWVSKNVPSFKVEPYTSSIDNYISKFEFDILSIHFPGYYKEYTTSWEAVCRRLKENTYFGGILSGNLFLNSVVKEIEAKSSSDIEKVKFALEEVKKVKWNEEKALYSSNTGLMGVYKDKIGNSADINLMLVSMLRKMNLNSHPVIMSTRDNGLLPFYPTREKLNYVIAYVKIDENVYLIDGTEEHIPLGLLPYRCINGQGRIVRDEVSVPVALTANASESKTIMYKLNILNDQVLEGEMSCLRANYAAYDFRKEYESFNNEDDYLQHIENKNPGLRILESNIENLDDISQPIRDKYKVEIKNALTSAGDIMYLTPMLHHKMKENPFKVDIRKYPVDFTVPREKTIVMNYTIPEGYEVVEIPQAVKMLLPENSGYFLYHITSLNNMITVNYKFSVNKQLFVQTEYQVLKELYNQIIKKHAEPVILKKI